MVLWSASDLCHRMRLLLYELLLFLHMFPLGAASEGSLPPTNRCAFQPLPGHLLYIWNKSLLLFHIPDARFGFLCWSEVLFLNNRCFDFPELLPDPHSNPVSPDHNYPEAPVCKEPPLFPCFWSEKRCFYIQSALRYPPELQMNNTPFSSAFHWALHLRKK